MPSFPKGRLAGSATRQTALHVGGACTLSTTTRDAKRCERFQRAARWQPWAYSTNSCVLGLSMRGVEGEGMRAAPDASVL